MWRDTGTIPAAPAHAARLIPHPVVPLPRRFAALLVALIATVSICGTALGSPRDVINDFSDNGVIDVCHSKADYDAARTLPVDAQYGDPQGAIDTAVATPALVGIAATPCPEVPSEGNGVGIGGIALIAIPIGLCILALALVFGGRRRRAAEGDAPDPPE